VPLLDVRELRALVIEIVLATDMSFHFQQVKNMKNLLSMPEKYEVYFVSVAGGSKGRQGDPNPQFGTGPYFS